MTETTKVRLLRMTSFKPFLAAAVMFVASVMTTQQAQAELIGYWPFEDGEGSVAADLSGSENHGSLTDDAAFTPDGFRGGALDLGDFDNGAAVLLTDASLGENGAAGFNSAIETQNVTITYWLNRNGDDNTNQWSFLFNNGGTRQLGTHAPWSDGNVYFDVSGCCGGDQRISTPMGDASTDGEWHHLAYRKHKPDGEALAQTSVWLDGALLVESDGFVISDILDIDSAAIGADQNGGNSQNGLIDEFCFWDEFLDDERIVALAGGAGCLPPAREPPGDFNADGTLNTDDFAIMLENFGKRFAFAEEPVNFGDFNGDLRINLKDFLAFRQVFNAAGAATSSVPEPNGLLLLALAIPLFLVRRQRRNV